MFIFLPKDHCLCRVPLLVLPAREVHQLQGGPSKTRGGGIRRIESRMDKFEHVQMEIHTSTDSQTGMLHNLFDHFGIDADA
jgi:hypothetical protein